jgi:predicted GNAT superfamily acetyltransferase
VFDPLDAKNAYLNIGKLGAIVRRYSVNHYGASSSPLHAGLDSDRLVAEWRLDVPPVDGGIHVVRSVVVPNEVRTLRRTDPPAVRRIQLAIREQFLRNLSDGLVVVACERLPHGCEYGFGGDPLAAGARA